MSVIQDHEYAQLANRVYSRTAENRTPVPKGWVELVWKTDDPVSGFSYGAYQKGNDIVISFTGSNENFVRDFGVATRVRHQNADFAFLAKPPPYESTTYALLRGIFVVATL